MNYANHFRAENWNFKRHWRCNFTIPEEVKIVQRYKNGESFRDMAKELNTSRQSLWKLVTRIYNIEPYQTVGYPVKYDLNTTIFSDIENEKSMYALGLIYSDGHISKAHNAIQFKTIDKEQVFNFRECFETTKDYYVVPPQNGNQKAYTFQIGYKPMIEDLLGLVPKRSKDTEKIHNKIIDSSYFHHFLRGFFDGDGSVSKNGGQIVFTGKKSLMENLAEAVKENYGVESSSLLKVKGGFVQDGKVNSYHLGYYKNDSKEKLYSEMYKGATLFLTRKKEIFEKFHNN